MIKSDLHELNLVKFNIILLFNYIHIYSLMNWIFPYLCLSAPTLTGHHSKAGKQVARTRHHSKAGKSSNKCISGNSITSQNDLIVLNWQKLKHGWQAQFLPAFQLIVGSQIKLCLRSLKPSLDLKFKSSSNFKRKSKTLIRRSETDIRRALVYFKLPKLVHAVKQSQLVKWHGLGLPP